jgi:DNA replication protein DnaC
MKRVAGDRGFLEQFEDWVASTKKGQPVTDAAALQIRRGKDALSASVSQCPHCADGWATWVGDGSNPGEVEGYSYSGRCQSCGSLQIQADLLNGAELPLEPWGATFETFELDRPGDDIVAKQRRRHAFEAAKRFVREVIEAGDDWPDVKGVGFGGMPGRGKTHLLAAIGFQLALELGVKGRRIGVRYVDFGDLMREAKGALDEKGTSTTKIIQRAAQVPILLLDELGTGRATDWEQDVAEEILRHRYKSKLPICFATNSHLGEAAKGDTTALVGRIGAQAYSRLKSLVQPPATLVGADQRDVESRN